MGRIVNHYFDSGGLVVKFLGGDTSVVVVENFEDGRNEWCNLSGDGVSKGGKIFDVNGLDDMLDEGLFDK